MEFSGQLLDSLTGAVTSTLDQIQTSLILLAVLMFVVIILVSILLIMQGIALSHMVKKSDVKPSLASRASSGLNAQNDNQGPTNKQVNSALAKTNHNRRIVVK